MPQPAELDRMVAELVSEFRASQASLEAQLEALLATPSKAAQASRIRALIRSNDALVRGLEASTGDWLATTLPEVYGLGAASAAEMVGASFQWTQPHLDAVQQLASGALEEVAKNLRGLRADTRSALQGWARDATRSGLLEARTAVAAGRDLAQVAARAGIFEVEYANGARHAMANYAEMAIRTTTATAYNRGSVELCREEGIEYVQYADGPDCGVESHDDPEKADGLVVRLDDVVEISHPNCRRACLPAPDGAPIGGAATDPGPARAAEPPPQPPPSRARQARTSRTGRSRA